MHTNRIIPGLLLVLACSVQAGTAQVATLSPRHPLPEETLRFSYDPSAEGAALHGAQKINLELLLVPKSGTPTIREIPMERSEDSWHANARLDAEDAVLLLFRFASGSDIDDNNGSSWSEFVYGSDGKPVEFAHLKNSQSLRDNNFFGFNRQGSIETALAQAEKELSLYPGNFDALVARWALLMAGSDNQAAITTIRPELDSALESHNDNGEQLYKLVGLYEACGDTVRAEELRKAAIAADPTGFVAKTTRFDAMLNEEDRVKRVALYEALKKDFPKEGEEKRESDILLVRLVASARDYEKAAVLLEQIPNAPGDLYNRVAWGMIEKGDNLEIATDLARKGVERYRNADDDAKPGYQTMRDWIQSQAYGLGMVADTYAFGLEKLGRLEEAEEAYETAYHAFEGEATEINERLVGAYVANKQYDKAISVGAKAVEQGFSSDALVDNYKIAFLAQGGDEPGFEVELERARLVALSAIRQRMMEELVNQPAVDFTLENLEGGSTTLSELRGKVVVVDFWATWCGPCLQSFPYLQKVIEHYKDNDDVVILTLNTWERKKGAALTAHVRQFMQENKYTFRVLMDQSTVSAYGVEGIPTKFIIDRNGMVQFKGIGFEGGQKMMDEMILQIDMLLSNDFYSAR
ncbi:MAG: TlpA family protein disulfide reductase [Ignavibacteria bacterium]|nr:TlpA family protein disulfide reductase [Ignavibacteria bacterium]